MFLFIFRKNGVNYNINSIKFIKFKLIMVRKIDNKKKIVRKWQKKMF